MGSSHFRFQLMEEEIMKKLLTLITMLTVGFGYQNCHEPSGWCYDVSTFQCFYMFETATVDADLAEWEAGDDSDVIGAFCGDAMVGFVLAAESYSTVPAMGNDGNFPTYCSGGDVPTFKIYDSSNDVILDAGSADVPPGWDNNQIFIMGQLSASNTFGCTDVDACNYDGGATADDGSCFYPSGCDNACGSTAEIDDCGNCGGAEYFDDAGYLPNGDCDCSGNVDDCAGVCGGPNTTDDCGDCDSDASNDNESCTGCTDSLADNYDSGNLFEDGSCEYTVPAVSDLNAEDGPERAILSWTAPSQMGDASYTYDVVSGGEVVKGDLIGTSTQVLNLEPDVEACFTVVAKNIYGESAASNEACCLPFEAAGMTWGFQVTASIDGFGSFDESDEFNFFGVAGDATNTYDDAYDIPEPPTPVGNYIELYFEHGDEWAHPWDTDRFTQDVRTEDPEYFPGNLMVWSAEISTNMDGDTDISFEAINQSYPGYPIYVLLDGSYHSVESGTTLSTYCLAGESKGFDIIVGNIVPQAPDALSSTSDDRSIGLDWDTDGDDLSDIGNRYPATSYNVYRDGSMAYESIGAGVHDDADLREEGQGLMYESSYDYIVTGLNAAGESTDGHMITYSDNSTESFGGRDSRTSNTTLNNIDPSADAAHAGCESNDGDCGSDGSYEIPHNGSPDLNAIVVSLSADGSDDVDEFDGISRYTWTQTDGNALDLVGSNSAGLSFVATNAFDGSEDSYSFNLFVESDYPVKTGSPSDLANEPACLDEDAELGCDNCIDADDDLQCDGDGIATRSDATDISLSVSPEPNEGPTAVSDIVAGMGDYNLNVQQWVVPHDGDPNTITANIWLTANASSDPEGDEITFEWTTGVEPEEFTDLNGNGSWDNSEPYFDADGNGQWDEYAPYTTSSIECNRVANVYDYTVTVTDAYGYSDQIDIVIGVLPEPNSAPQADAGTDQLWFMLPDDPNVYDIWEDFEDVNGNYVYDEGEPFTNESRYCTSVDGTIGDPDSHYQTGEGDALTFDWSDGGAIDHETCLPLGMHTLTLCTTDIYGASHCDDMTITVNEEPAPAVPGAFSVTNSLYYTEMTFNSSDNQIKYGDDEHVFGMNAVSYNVYRDGALLDNISDNQGTEYRLDNNLEPSTEYCYSVAGINSHGDEGSSTDEVCISTGDLPTVTVTAPNGAEIWEVGQPYPVSWNLTDSQYISKVEVFYSDERQGESSEAMAEGLSGNLAEGVDFSSTSLEGHADEVSTVYEDARIRVEITDIGNYEGASKGSSSDSSDDPFTMSTTMLTRSISSGWHMFGTALDPYFSTMDENLSADLGEWGTGWIAYDQDGGFENLELNLGQGYFLAVTADLENMESLTLNGDVVTSDDMSRATLSVDGGWTLLSNPLVSSVNKSMLTVTTNDETYSWDDAVAFGFVSPTVYGWDNGYASNHNLVRFQGNWLHTSRALDINVRPHTAGALSRMEEVDGWKLSLRASDKNGLASSDLVTVGITENADDSFIYGEDEFDLPDPMVDSYVDLFINNMGWIGKEDINGNVVESPYFAADIRSIPAHNDAQVWNVSGIAHNMVGDVELTWNMDEIDNSYNVQLQVNGKTYDLREETSVLVSQDELSNMNILIGSGSMGTEVVDIPESFSLSSAYPNPFNPSTNMTLALDADSQVSMMVYNLVGQVVDVLVDGNMTAGYHQVTWNASNVPSGVYIVKVNTGTNTSIQKVMLMK